MRATRFDKRTWENDYTRAIDTPLITQSTYWVRDGKIANVMDRLTRKLPAHDDDDDPGSQTPMDVASINEEIWNQGNFDLIDERYAGDYVRHEAGYPAELAGATGLKLFIQSLHAGFPDWRCTVEDTLAAGDKVMVRYALFRARTRANGTACRRPASRSSSSR